MVLKTALKYLLGVLLLGLLGFLGGAGNQYFFVRVKVVKTPLVANETKLNQYLKTEKGDGINSFEVLRQNSFKKTDNCVAPAIDAELLFCFEKKMNDGKLTINVYPNQEVINTFDSQIVNRLLNLNILMILENRFGIDPERKGIILTENQNDFAFRW